MKLNKLTLEEENIIIHKGTQAPFVGEYTNNKENGIYYCKQCNTPLFNSNTKFDSHSGWPSFDNHIDSNVKQVPDADGVRIEIICAKCDGHLGHIFKNEGFSDTNNRYCVNSISLIFKS